MNAPLFRRIALAIALVLPLSTTAAQIRTVDPSAAAQPPATAIPEEEPYTDPAAQDDPPADPTPTPAPLRTAPAPAGTAEQRASEAAGEPTYGDEDVLTAAENTFGKGAEGLAKIIERTLKDQGRPTAYIAGREASGALGIGLRYGSGTLFHKVEGDSPVYWTGPSLGFDVGANGAKTFVLVYNLHDVQDLYERFPAAEGTLYVVGGFTASYQKRGDVVLVPIRLGVGWRAGVNVGYTRYSPKGRILPF